MGVVMFHNPAFWMLRCPETLPYGCCDVPRLRLLNVAMSRDPAFWMLRCPTAWPSERRNCGTSGRFGVPTAGILNVETVGLRDVSESQLLAF